MILYSVRQKPDGQNHRTTIMIARDNTHLQEQIKEAGYIAIEIRELASGFAGCESGEYRRFKRDSDAVARDWPENDINNTNENKDTNAE